MSKILTNQLAHTSGGAAVFTLPTSDGSANQFLQTNGSGTLSFASETGTSKRTTSSNSALDTNANVNYTGFSSSLKRFDLQFDGLSSSGANWGVRLGTGGTLKTSGHNVGSGYIRSSSNVTTSYDGGFWTYGMNETAYTNNGYFSFNKIGTTDTWWCNANISEDGTKDHWFIIFGYVILSGTLDIISFLVESGTFDAGQVRLVTYTD
tara:strand:+ start:979 stop:1599 length:621 start_codon:yes stop_codon:yes gene_type:complete